MEMKIREREENTMTEAEQKQIAIDNYINLMRIKAEEKTENRELERQIRISKIKLSAFSIDLSEIEKLF